MYKKSIFLFLLLFFAQTVLAGIDLHDATVSNSIKVNQTIDITDYYIDIHYCNAQTDSHIDDSIDSSNSISHASHHHDCHGHTTPCVFSSNIEGTLSLTLFYSPFSYIFSDYFTNLASPQRPPKYA